jgi:hypothetical protein
MANPATPKNEAKSARIVESPAPAPARGATPSPCAAVSGVSTNDMAMNRSNRPIRKIRAVKTRRIGNDPL